MLRFILLLSAIVPATILFLGYSILVTGLLLSDPNDVVQAKELSMLFISLLGFLGYIGLLLLLMNMESTRPKLIFLFLLSGILAFVLFNSTRGTKAWIRVFTMKEPGEWFILVWPVIVSLLFIFIIGKQLAIAAKN